MKWKFPITGSLGTHAHTHTHTHTHIHPHILENTYLLGTIQKTSKSHYNWEPLSTVVMGNFWKTTIYVIFREYNHLVAFGYKILEVTKLGVNLTYNLWKSNLICYFSRILSVQDWKKIKLKRVGGGFKVKDSQAGSQVSKDSRLPPPDVVDAPHQPWVKVPKLLLEHTRRWSSCGLRPQDSWSHRVRLT